MHDRLWADMKVFALAVRYDKYGIEKVSEAQNFWVNKWTQSEARTPRRDPARMCRNRNRMAA